MDGNVLLQAFKMMDDLGITKRGVDEDVKAYYPYILLDGHISRIGEEFLRYVNDPPTRWGTGLGAPYGTSVYQFHDDERENGTLKKAMAKAKSAFFAKKRMKGLPAVLLPVEIVMNIVKKKLRELAAGVDKIKDEMEEPSFRLGVKHLEKLVRWKT